MSSVYCVNSHVCTSLPGVNVWLRINHPVENGFVVYSADTGELNSHLPHCSMRDVQITKTNGERLPKFRKQRVLKFCQV